VEKKAKKIILHLEDFALIKKGYTPTVKKELSLLFLILLFVILFFIMMAMVNPKIVGL